jgi:protein-S-isoprenylcysteine O-methyltransferase Ste14
MFKYIYLTFVGFAFFLKAFITTAKIHKIDKITGVIYAQWITKLMYIFYFVPFIISPIEFLIVKRQINYYITALAFIFYIAGWLLSYWAIKTMGKFWTIEIEIREEHPIIKKGPYKYMRHPHYLFVISELFCLSLVGNAYYTFVVTAIIFIPLIFLRIIREEKEMIKKLGADYLQYKKEVWGLFPYPIFKSGVKE